MIFGSDGVEMIRERAVRQKQEQPDKKEITVNLNALLALIYYYRQLTTLCIHEWDVTSPIDTVELCRKCGLMQKCPPQQ